MIKTKHNRITATIRAYIRRGFSLGAALLLVLSISLVALGQPQSASADYACSDRSHPGNNCYATIAYHQNNQGAEAYITNSQNFSLDDGSQLLSNEIWMKDTISNNGFLNCTNYPNCYAEVGFADTYYCFSNGNSDCHTRFTFMSYVTNRSWVFSYIDASDPGTQSVRYAVDLHTENTNNQYIAYTASYPGCNVCQSTIYTPYGGGFQPNWTIYGTRLTGSRTQPYTLNVDNSHFAGLIWYNSHTPVQHLPVATYQSSSGDYDMGAYPLDFIWGNHPNGSYNNGGDFWTF